MQHSAIAFHYHWLYFAPEFSSCQGYLSSAIVCGRSIRAKFLRQRYKLSAECFAPTDTFPIFPSRHLSTCSYFLIADALKMMLKVSVTMNEVSVTMIETSETMIEVSETMIEGFATMIEGFVTMIEEFKTTIETSATMIETSATMIEGFATMIEGFVTMIEVSKTTIEVSETLLKAC